MRTLIGLLLLWPTLAGAAEVVALGDVDAATLDAVRAKANARGPTLEPAGLRAAATEFTPEQLAVYDALAATLRDVRTFETKLDGELIIMRDLERPLESIEIIRDDADREAVVGALAYQGFAVERFFATDLATDERAEPFRVELTGTTMVRPWVDAVAIEPAKPITPYQIAEAPSRVAYEGVRVRIKAEALPATIVLPDLPAGARLVVDGRATTPGPGNLVKVLPGRHWVHIALGEHILGAWQLRLDAASEDVIALASPDSVWEPWLDEARAGTITTAPPSVLASVRALGGEVWLVRGGSSPSVVSLDASGTVEPVSLAPARTTAPSSARSERDALVGWSVGVDLEGGWMYSGDFYLQDPVNVPRESSVVNAGFIAIDVQGTAEIGVGRIGAGVDLSIPFGDDQVALTGAGGLRPRPYVYGVFGTKWASVTGGYLFPYHPAAGVQLTIPVFKGLEVRATGMGGFPTTLTRADGGSYDTDAVARASLGIGWRFGR